MSYAYEYSYRLAAQRQRKLYLNRLSKNTEQLYRNYHQRLEEMKNKGYAAYISDEMEQLAKDLSQVRDTLVSDPEGANRLCTAAGYRLRDMPALVKAAEEQFDRSERMRLQTIEEEKVQQQDELMREYYRILQSITNPVEVNLSVAEMAAVRNEISVGKITTLSQLRERAGLIKKYAETKLVEWKKKTLEDNSRNIAEEAINEVEEMVKSEKIENEAKTAEFLTQLKELRKNLTSGGISPDMVKNKLAIVSSKLDDAVISEETRRETVKAIIKQLKSMEFTVEVPTIVQSDGCDFVKIVAKKPSGHRAVVNLDNYGKLAYKFDHYENLTCLKDIEDFYTDLDKVYSVELSDERVLWENPDRLSRESCSLPQADRRNV